MNRIIALLLALVICVSLAGCGKVTCFIEGCENEAVEDASFEDHYCSKHLADKKAFEISKIAYQNVNEAYDIAHQFGTDLYSAWYLVSYQNQSLMNTNTVKAIATEVQYLDEEEIQQGLAFVLANNKYKEEWYELSEEDKDSYIELAGKYAGDDFFNQTNCLFITTWSVIRAYEVNGKTEEARRYLETAQSNMRELSEKYSDYKHYPNLKGFFTTTGSYLDVCCNSELSFTQFKDVKNQYEKEARDYINDLDFIFD